MAGRNLRRRLGAIVISVAFVGLLSLPLAARLAGVPPVEVENRALVEAPAVHFAELLEPNYVDGTWGTFLQDHLAFRDWAVHFKALVSLRLFEESSNERVLIADDGFLFYDQEIDRGCAPNFASAEEIVRNVRAWADYYKSKDGEMLLVLVPDKAMIYRDKLRPDQLERYACVEQKNRAVRAGFDSIDSLGFVDLYPEMKAEAERSREPVYFRTDTHWKWNYGLILVERIVNYLKPDLYAPDRIATEDSSAQPDLSRMLGIKERIWVTNYRATREDVETRVTAPSEGIPRVAYSVGREREFINGPTLLISDSFFNKSVLALQPYASELISIRPDHLLDPDVSAAVRKSRHLVVEMVMRNVYELFSDRLNKENLERVVDAADERPATTAGRYSRAPARR